MTDQTTELDPGDFYTRAAAVQVVFDTYGCGCDSHGSNGVADQCRAWRQTRAVLVVDALAKAGLLAGIPETCTMTHTEPYDFAQCETHDTTFALGETCKFNGRLMIDVLADEADEQRGRAVHAEHLNGHAVQETLLKTWRAVLDQHRRVTYEQATGERDPEFGDVCRTCMAVWPCPTISAAPEGIIDALVQFPHLGRAPEQDPS